MKNTKKVLALICAAVLALSVLTACSGISLKDLDIPDPSEFISSALEGITSEVISDTVSDIASEAEQKSDSIVSQGKNTVQSGLEVVDVPFKDYTGEVYLLISNKTGKVIDVEAEIAFYDKDGKLVGTDDGYVDTVDAETTVCMDYLSCDKEFVTYEYEVTYSETDLDYYAPVDRNLALKVEKKSDSVVVSLTNNGKIPAKYVWYHAFFYKNGELTYVDNNYCEDDDSEIKVGKTCTSEQTFWGDEDKGFDDVKIYYHGEGYAKN